MGRKYNLPDSLELLLDTMCNTFGGIMFIAISLVVISQVMIKSQHSMSTEQISEQIIQQMQQKVEALQNEIAELKQKKIQLQLTGGRMTPEKKKIINNLSAVMEENLYLQNNLELLKVKINTLLIQINSTKTEIDKNELKLENKRKELASKQKLLEEQKIKLQAEVAELTKELSATQPRNLRFAREHTTSLTPYWIFVKENAIYRYGNQLNPHKGEVVAVRFSHHIKMQLVNGTNLSDSPESELDYLLSPVNRHSQFVSIAADNHSFATLMTLLQYLRTKQYKMRWNINPDFIFILSDNVEYNVSE